MLPVQRMLALENVEGEGFWELIARTMIVGAKPFFPKGQAQTTDQ